MGFEPHARHPVFDPEGHRHRRSRPEFPMSPARRERIERKASPKIHHGNHRPAIGLQYLAPAAPKMPADQADDSDDRDASNHEVSNSPSHSTRHHPHQNPCLLKMEGRDAGVGAKIRGPHRLSTRIFEATTWARPEGSSSLFRKLTCKRKLHQPTAP